MEELEDWKIHEPRCIEVIDYYINKSIFSGRVYVKYIANTFIHEVGDVEYVAYETARRLKAKGLAVEISIDELLKGGVNP